MKDKDLEKLLANQQYDFDLDFVNQVLDFVEKEETPIRHISWFVTGVAVSILLCAIAVYIQDGSLTFDSILGAGSLDYSTIDTYYINDLL